MLNVTDLTKTYASTEGPVDVLRAVSLSVAAAKAWR